MRDNASPDNAKLDQRLQQVLQSLERFELLSNLQKRQGHKVASVESKLMGRSQDAELARRLAPLDGADVAQLLEMLPAKSRQTVWRNLHNEQAGEALSEVIGDVAEDLISITDDSTLMNILDTIKPDEISALKKHIPADVLQRFKERMAEQDRRNLESSARYPEHTVGALMKHDAITLSGDTRVGEATGSLRQQAPLPEQTDRVFICDEYHRYLGAVTITDLLLADEQQTVREIMDTNAITFDAEEAGERAALAFERYDLISAAVVDRREQLLGRLTVETVMDEIRERAEEQALASAGLSEDTDLFAPVWKGARQRWPWLAINLLTAFAATRFIAVFEATLEQIVSLAVLMPIIASVGGNTGNQTIALFIRGLALDQIKSGNRRFLLRKELAISLINGLIWGALLALVAGFLYRDAALGAVMMAAMTLNLVVAALVGAAVPLLADRLGRDPAMGSSVLLTFTTDSMGFFIFLGLATVFLL